MGKGRFFIQYIFRTPVNPTGIGYDIYKPNHRGITMQIPASEHDEFVKSLNVGNIENLQFSGGCALIEIERSYLLRFGIPGMILDYIHHPSDPDVFFSLEKWSVRLK